MLGERVAADSAGRFAGLNTADADLYFKSAIIRRWLPQNLPDRRLPELEFSEPAGVAG